MRAIIVPFKKSQQVLPRLILAKETGDGGSATVTGGLEKFSPAELSMFEFEFDGGLDLDDFGLDEFAVGIAFGVVLDKEVSGFFNTIFLDQLHKRMLILAAKL